MSDDLMRADERTDRKGEMWLGQQKLQKYSMWLWKLESISENGSGFFFIIKMCSLQIIWLAYKFEMFSILLK